MGIIKLVRGQMWVLSTDFNQLYMKLANLKFIITLRMSKEDNKSLNQGMHRNGTKKSHW